MNKLTTALAALLALSPGAASAQQGTGGGGAPGGSTGVHMGTEGATTRSGQQEGAGSRSTGVDAPSRSGRRDDYSRDRKARRPLRRRPIRGAPDRTGPVETRPSPSPDERPAPSTQSQPGTPGGR